VLTPKVTWSEPPLAAPLQSSPGFKWVSSPMLDLVLALISARGSMGGASVGDERVKGRMSMRPMTRVGATYGIVKGAEVFVPCE